MSDYIVKHEDIETHLSSGDIQSLDLYTRSSDQIHVLHKDKGFDVTLIESNFSSKEYTVSINGNIYKLQIGDVHDQMVASMGLLDVEEERVNDVQAPIPGLIIDIPVKEGQEVKEGDALVVLSAMKMENILVAPNDGIVETIHINLNDAVEKERLLITLA